MKDLFTYMKQLQPLVDCHVHNLENDEFEYPEKNVRLIRMVKNDIKYKDEPLKPKFDDLKVTGEVIFDEPKRPIVLVVGKDFEETKTILDFKWVPDGIGELKAYKHYKDSEGEIHTYENAKFLEDVSKLVEKSGHHYPIFIHWDLIDKDNVEKLKKILQKHKGVKYVLCHCGINELDDPWFAFLKALDLQRSCQNLWLEVSWIALDFFAANPSHINNIDPYRLLLGTDTEPSDPNFKERFKTFKRFSKHVPIWSNLKRLFQKNIAI